MKDKISPKDKFYVGEETIYHLLKGNTRQKMSSNLLLPLITAKPLISTKQTLSRSVQGTTVMNRTQSKKNKKNEKMQQGERKEHGPTNLIIGSLSGHNFGMKYAGSLKNIADVKNPMIEDPRCKSSPENQLFRSPRVRDGSNLKVSSMRESDIISFDLCNRTPRKTPHSPDNLPVGIADPMISQIAGGSAYDKRKEYGKNLEKNWLKELQHGKKKKKKSSQPVVLSEDLVRPRELDGLFRSFYTSGSEDEDYYKYDFHVKLGQTDEEEIVTDEEEATDKNAYYSLSDKSGRLLRFASTDVLFSESDQNEEGVIGIEFFLDESILTERDVEYKMRKKRRRKFMKYYEDDSDSDNQLDISDDKLKNLEGLNDTELRAFRLNLKKKETEVKDDFDVFMTNETLREMTKSALARIKPKVKRKKKKNSRKIEQQKIQAEKRLFKEMMRQRFLAEHSRLLRDMASDKFSIFSTLNWLTDPLQNYSSATMAFLDNTYNDLALLNILPGVSILNAAALSHLAPESARALLRSQEVPHITLVDGKFVIRPHPLVTRRRSDPGVERKKEIRYTTDPPIAEAEDVQTVAVDMKTPRRKRKEKMAISAENESGSGTAAEEKDAKDGEKISDSNDETVPCNTEDKQSDNAQNNISVTADTQTYSADNVIREVIINTKIIRRTKSARHICATDPEPDLYQLTEGLDFPAKDIKIQIALRRIRKQKAKRLSLACSVASSERSDRTVEALPVETPEEEPPEDQTVETARTRRRFITGWGLSSYGDPPSFTREELDAEIPRLSALFMQMRECRYIRWTRRDQAIIDRIFELEMEDELFPSGD